jgi:hypothetical protein
VHTSQHRLSLEPIKQKKSSSYSQACVGGLHIHAYTFVHTPINKHRWRYRLLALLHRFPLADSKLRKRKEQICHGAIHSHTSPLSFCFFFFFLLSFIHPDNVHCVCVCLCVRCSVRTRFFNGGGVCAFAEALLEVSVSVSRREYPTK